MRGIPRLPIPVPQVVQAGSSVMTDSARGSNRLVILAGPSCAGKSPLAMRYCKRALHAGFDVDLETGQRIERDLFALCFASADQKEGMGAFLEKRTPEFTGE